MKRDQHSSPTPGRPRRRPRESAIGENGRADRPRQGLLSSSLVGSTNRERVLQALFDLGPTSRAELARQAGVNRTTISGIVQPLIDQGFLVEGEPLPAGEEGGKRARPLWFSPDTQPICGVLLMPDLVHACLVTMEGKKEGPAYCRPQTSHKRYGIVMVCVSMPHGVEYGALN